ncbi:flippase [Chitinophaga pendula]|uniref:flippase n=1 Tax=Chitinophaga TaxID=79328 RepID=UPI000BB03EC2|nr:MULTISPECIES: flippase [Chitinophaga]ASZ14194.1 hypothetical protein CK934_26200 [Chitinophaga sp. MD30]UCJ08170.1 flippase [Chitinophaga pendula]
MFKVFANSGWLFIDKFARLAIGLVIMAMIARHIGPEAFGIWSYAIALTTIGGGIAVLGLDKLLVKELVSHPERRDTLMATALLLRLATGSVICVLCVGMVMLYRGQPSLYVYCTLIGGLNVIMQSFDVFDYYYQSQHALQQVILPKVGVFLVFCLIKWIYILLDAPLLTFVWCSFAELVMMYAIIYAVYWRRYGLPLWKAFRLAEARYLLGQSWPLLFASLLILLYMKSDQLLLDTLGTPVVLGEYAAAARISEIWYAIPVVIATAMLPGLIAQRERDVQRYEQSVRRWMRLSWWCSFGVALLVTLIARPLIQLLYGIQYPQSALILSIHIWANIPVFLATAIMQCQVAEGAYKLNLYATFTGLLVNVAINIWLIPVMAGVGAAIGTLVSYVAVCTTLIVMDSGARARLLSWQLLAPQQLAADCKLLAASLRVFAGRYLSLSGKKTLAE